ncbi:hypothetical protein SDJN03_25373, partial [Cucurbita argyrosperma subsp. sororia]
MFTQHLSRKSMNKFPLVTVLHCAIAAFNTKKCVAMGGCDTAFYRTSSVQFPLSIHHDPITSYNRMNRDDIRRNIDLSNLKYGFVDTGARQDRRQS